MSRATRVAVWRYPVKSHGSLPLDRAVLHVVHAGVYARVVAEVALASSASAFPVTR